MSHALLGYDGLCKNIHGHGYKMEITLIGQIQNTPGHPKDGMVIDFGNLKKLVNEQIINKFDHTLVLNSQTPQKQIEALKSSTERIIVVDFQPTSENLCVYFAQTLSVELPGHVELYSIRLYETETSYAEWFTCDNLLT